MDTFHEVMDDGFQKNTKKYLWFRFSTVFQATEKRIQITSDKVIYYYFEV